MANTLTGLIPVFYDALDIVSREQLGFIPAVTRNMTMERVAVNQTVTYPVAPPVAAADITPGVNAPDTGDQAIGNGTLTITKARMAPVRWTGEEVMGLGSLHSIVLRDQFAQAMRTLCNEVEADLAALYTKASRAYGTAGTPPFGTVADLSDVAQMRKILTDNGAPSADLQLVLGSSAIANLRAKQAGLFRVNEAGTDALLREGIVGRLEGFQLHESAAVKTHTKGTGTSYVIDGTGNTAIGSTTLKAKTGSGTLVAGDVLTINSVTDHRYVVASGLAAPGTFDIAVPGTKVTVADGNTIALAANYAANMAFARSAIHLATRMPAMPPGGDMADDVMEIQDPNSGLAFQVAVYRQYRRVRYEVGLAWGVGCTSSAHVGILLG